MQSASAHEPALVKGPKAAALKSQLPNKFPAETNENNE